MAAYKRFEMKLMMDNSTNPAQNSLDFLLMPPPNMPMNTPFVMSSERMSGGRALQSNATPFLLRQDSIDHNMDLDCDSTNWNVKTSNTNGFGKNGADTNINDKIVFRTNGGNLANGYSGAANGLEKATNDFESSSLNNQFKTPTGRGIELNAAKRATNGMTMVANGYSGSKTSTTNSNGYDNAQNTHSVVSNNHENASATKNGSLFPNGTTSIFGGHQGHNTNIEQDVSNDHGYKWNANKGALFNGNGNNGTNIRHDVSNGHEKASNASIFPRLNHNSNDTGQNNVMESESSQTLHVVDASKQKLYSDDNGFDDNRFYDDGNDNIYAADDEQRQKNFNDNLTATAKQQTSTVNSFGMAQFDGNLNQQPNGQTNSGNFAHFCGLIDFIPIKLPFKIFSSRISTKIGIQQGQQTRMDVFLL